ncbi:glycosyltransferase [Aggregatilinea lenta]|uniref:glycosyltransferase n=1 Tax=Aggregatilinea lenta TaxID=913108 RepID=UPI000E5BC88E|nr:glycosyltransferase [Aggregatilinea lenta]
MPANRIVHLSKMTGVSGSEGHLLVLLRGLRARGLDVRLWILIEPGKPLDAYAAQLEAAGVPVEQILIRRDLDPALWRDLLARLHAIQPDVVHTHLFHADLYGTLAARRAGVPYVISSRHNDDKFRRRTPIRLLLHTLWRRTDAGIAISDAIRRFSIEVEGARPDQIRTIHYGLNPASIDAPAGMRTQLSEQIGAPPDALLVGSVCRLIEQKGLMDGLRGFAQVARDVPEAHYVLAGDGPLRGALEAEAIQLGVADRVHFLGWRDDARAVMSALDLLLAPSLWEGFGLVFLEAMALGVPILSTCVSAIPEVVIDGETGWLVPPHDADAVAVALREALVHPPLLMARGRAGRQRLETHFTVERMVDQTVEVYRSLGETR